LYNDAGDIGPVFKDILGLLGIDLRGRLLASEIEDHTDMEERNRAYAVKQIAAEVHAKAADRNVAHKFRPAFSKLLIWFRDNGALAKSLFPDLYRQKHLLYNEDEILDNIERAEQLSALLSDYSVQTVEELRTAFGKQSTTSQLLPVTQQIIASMGITSVDEWVEALKDKDFAVLFSHESAPTTDMFVYAQSLIQQAKEGIIAHLRGLRDYNLDEMDETAPTVLAGIRKNGRSLMIVTRPAYDGEVIIYYQSERDVLDFEESELWVDDGQEVRRVTLGRLLKTTQIRRFPV
jgi:hypothetical protein